MTGRLALVLVLVCGPAGAQDFAGRDLAPPVIDVTSPARGEYMTTSVARVEGTATDPASGIAALTVNGQPVSLGANGRFSAAVTLELGANLIDIRAVDGAGNAATSTVGVMFAPEYRPPGLDVPLAAVARLNEPTLDALAPRVAEAVTGGGALAKRLTRPPRLFRGEVSALGLCVASADVTVQSVTFDPIQIGLDAVPGGLNALVQVPNFRLQANARSYCGIRYSVSGEVSANATVAGSISFDVGRNGRFQAFAAPPAVPLDGFRFDIYGIPSIIENLVRTGVEREIRRRLEEEVPPRVARALERRLDELRETEERMVGDTGIAFRLRPAALAIDGGGLTVVFDGDVTAAKDPATPTVPGSVFRPPGTIPAYADAPGFLASVHENLFNRALFTSWQAGFWNIQIDQAFLAQMGSPLPFQLNASLLAGFFPQLAGMLPNPTAPVAIRLEPRMQPVVKITGDPAPLRLDVGEVHVAILVDDGQGFVPVVAVAAHLEAPADVGIDPGGLTVALGPPSRVAADIVGQPLGPVTDVEVERFLRFVVPPAIQFAASSIAPLPLPSLQGLALVNVDVYPDGLLGEFLTVEGDVR